MSISSLASRLKRWAAPPDFPGDEDKTLRAGRLNLVLLNILTLIPVLFLGNLLGGRMPGPVYAANIAAFACALLLRRWMRRGKVQPASLALLVMSVVLVTAGIAAIGTIRSPTAAMFLLVVITGGLLFEGRGILVMTAVCAAALAGLAVLESAGRLPRPDFTITITQWIAYAAVFGWTGSLTSAALRQLRDVIDRMKADAAERARTEAALRESEDKLRSIYEKSLDAVLLTSPEGGILAANPAACRMFGRTEEEIVRLGRAGIIDVSDPRLAAAIEERARTGRFRGELFGLRKDGTRFPIEVSTSVFADRDGKSRTSMVIRDITERRRREERLWIAAAIAHNLNEGVNMVRDSDGTIVFATPRFARMFGYEGEELVGRPVGILNAPGERTPEAIADGIMNRLRTEGFWRGDIRNRKKDGSLFWCHVSISSFDHPDFGRVWISIHEDISERKQIEKELTDREERLRLANMATHDVIWDWDIVNDQQLWNREGGVIFGWTHVVERPQTAAWWAERIHPEDRERVKSGFFRAVNDPASDSWQDEYRFLKADGSYADVIDRGYILRSADGRAVRMIGAMADVTERKRSEEDLRTAKAFLHTVLLNAPITIFAMDERGVFTLSEGKGLERVGLKPGENVGASARHLYGSHRFVAPTGEAMTGDEVITRALGGDTVNAVDELNGIFFDNSIGPIHNGEGKIVGVVGVATDITARRLAEEDVRRSREDLRILSARLERAREEEKANIAREIHDELGQRLTGLIMDLAMLERKIPNALKPLKAEVQAMEEEADGLVKTVRKIATGLRPGILDDMGLVAAVEWQAEEFAVRAGIPCACDCVELAEEIDPDRAICVFRILQEALTNVARHARARSVRIELREEGGQVVLRVEDDGRGIGPAEIAGRESLGLAGMRERARLLGGAIRIAGTPGRGTTIELAFPRGPGVREEGV